MCICRFMIIICLLMYMPCFLESLILAYFEIRTAMRGEQTSADSLKNIWASKCPPKVGKCPVVELITHATEASNKEVNISLAIDTDMIYLLLMENRTYRLLFQNAMGR